MFLHRDAEGRTPLFLSVSGQHAGTTKLLLEAGASASSKDNNGVMVRDLARKQDILDIVNQFV